MNRRAVVTGLAALSVLLLAGCPSDPGPNPPQRFDITLKVLVTSEMADMPPLLEQLKRDTGITLVLEPLDQPIGTLAATERLLNNPKQYDLAWLPTASYHNLLLDPGDGRRPVASEPTMASPVIVGVKQSVAQRFGWTATTAVSWADIAAKAKTGELKYGMTDPSQSNSGFAAMAGAATAFAGTGRALRADEIDEARLADFLSGHELRAPTSGLLKSEFLKAPERIDAMINYESVLLEINAGLTDKLQLIYPSDGVVTADYPLLLFNDQRRAEYQAIVDWLTGPAIQKRIMDETGRRPIRPDVPLAERFGARGFVPLPFPATFDTCKKLFAVYQNLGRLSHVIYVLDLSGSMEGDRLARLKAAFVDLTGGDTSISGQFNHFRRNERISIVTFADRVLDEKQFVIDDPTPDSASYRAIRDYVEGLTTGGNTAIYSAAARAYQIAEAALAANADYLTTVVLLSDGENNRGIGAQEFLDGMPVSVRHVRTFAVLFGEAKPEELTVITTQTRGELIDANATSLVEAFKTIRGYQ